MENRDAPIMDEATAGGVDGVSGSGVSAEPILPPPNIAPIPGKRGRKAYPRTADGRIIRPDGTIGPKARSAATGSAGKSIVQSAPQRTITDEDAGKAISGVFMVSAIPLGPHWRLFPHEIDEMGKAFGPIFRRYPDKVEKWIDFLMLGPVVGAVMVPRIVIHKLKTEGKIEAHETRGAVLNALLMMEFEKQQDIAQMAREKEQFLRMVRDHAMQQPPKPAPQPQAAPKPAPNVTVVDFKKPESPTEDEDFLNPPAATQGSDNADTDANGSAKPDNVQ